MIDINNLWQSVLNEIQLEVSKSNFIMWFKDTSLGKIDDGVVYLHVPSAFYQEWLQKKFHNNILRVLRKYNEQVRALEYVISDKKDKKKVENKQSPQINASFPLQDLYINKNDNLNPKYTFENFVVGPYNELAHAASQAVIQRPGQAYNPFFIYGDTGRGKTHLIQAIGNFIKEAYPEKKVYYMTSEKFGSECLVALQTGKTQDFKERYRKYDVIIMDDIQFFSNKEKFQEELFHLFNTLLEQNKQFVFSSDKHPNQITGLEDRLRSRFGAGMLIDLPSPDLESRLAIIKAKSLLQNLILESELIEYIAESLDGNIRELEGVMNTISIQTQMKGRLTINDIKTILKDNTKPKKNTSVKDVIKIVANYYNINEESIYDKTRKKEVVKPRQVIMFLLREDFNISYPSIGEKMGGRDHTTVIHSCEKVKDELKTNSLLSQEIGQLRTML
ncbi:MAG: chromosomal replication initiator protein DnaA [Candidatus Pacebacteria bacterium]|nr:chromosomal replication initiator protein DnaA [Candidatus Paceibacterota bacterium]